MAPEVVTGSATSVDHDSAVLEGTVNRREFDLGPGPIEVADAPAE